MKNAGELRGIREAEEAVAPLRGWDFSHSNGRFRSEEDDMPCVKSSRLL